MFDENKYCWFVSFPNNLSLKFCSFFVVCLSLCVRGGERICSPSLTFLWGQLMCGSYVGSFSCVCECVRVCGSSVRDPGYELSIFSYHGTGAVSL